MKTYSLELRDRSCVNMPRDTAKDDVLPDLRALDAADVARLNEMHANLHESGPALMLVEATEHSEDTHCHIMLCALAVQVPECPPLCCPPLVLPEFMQQTKNVKRVRRRDSSMCTRTPLPLLPCEILKHTGQCSGSLDLCPSCITVLPSYVCRHACVSGESRACADGGLSLAGFLAMLIHHVPADVLQQGLSHRNYLRNTLLVYFDEARSGVPRHYDAQLDVLVSALAQHFAPHLLPLWRQQMGIGKRKKYGSL